MARRPLFFRQLLSTFADTGVAMDGSHLLQWIRSKCSGALLPWCSGFSDQNTRILEHQHTYYFALSFILFLLVSCAGEQFTLEQQETFDTLGISENQTKVISFKNPSTDEVQKILGVGFAQGSNQKGHFRINRVLVGSRAVGLKDVSVPAGSSL